MSTACPRSSLWLNKSLKLWLQTCYRSVSTTSAINRGLRATKNSDEGQRRESSEKRGQKGRRQDLATWVKRGEVVKTVRTERVDMGAAGKRIRATSTKTHSDRPAAARNDLDLLDGSRRQQERRWIFSTTKSDNERVYSMKNVETPRHKRKDSFGKREKTEVEEPPVPITWTIKKPLAKAQQDLRTMLTGIKQPLGIMQLIDKQSGNANAQAWPEARLELREVLRTVNRNYSSGESPNRAVSEALKATLPDEQWGWRMQREDYTYPRLWLNRPERRIELVYKDGTSDADVIQDIAEPENNLLDNLGIPVNDMSEHDDGMPVSIPYTTAASTFLYGANTVFAALKAKRRKLYQLHISSRLSGREAQGESIRNLAEEAGVPIQTHSGTRVLDEMSQWRPHNGVVLENSVLPAPPVLSLGTRDTSTGNIPMKLQSQSAEDKKVHGSSDFLRTSMDTWRQPFIVILDGVVDPHNVGSILRTCYFYGVDAVAIATNTCANLNSATLAKASSGACEAIPILALPKPSAFVYECKKAGWSIFAAVSPFSKPQNTGTGSVTTSSLISSPPLMDKPCILMLGSEGEGLRENLMNRANFFISVEGEKRAGEERDAIVDSLNVSVSTGVLLESFLRKPDGVEKFRRFRIVKSNAPESRSVLGD